LNGEDPSAAGRRKENVFSKKIFFGVVQLEAALLNEKEISHMG